MDDLTPPSIPAPQDRKHSDDEATLSRVDGPAAEPGDRTGVEHEIEPLQRAESNADSHADVDPDTGPVTVEAWAERVSDADGALGRRTICRMQVPALERIDAVDGDEGVRAAVEAARLAVARSHAPEGGVATANDRELVFVLPDGVAWSAAATTVATEIGARIGDPDFELPDLAVGLAEVGVSGETIEDALRLSALGLADAIEAGGGARVVTADEEQRREREERVRATIASSLESGDGFRLVYQPKYAVEGESMVGAEALLRHDGGELGAISPAEFVPLAKRFGMLERLDHWVVEKAVSAIASWREEGVLGVPISLNVGPSIFFSKDFVTELAHLISKHDLEAEDVQIEVSASDVLERLEPAEARIRELQLLGVGVALDDFGREDTALADLRRLPVDVVKVHRSLILDLLGSDSASTLVRGVLSLARLLGIETVAAGVEQPEQLEMLRTFGCDAVQGFMLSQPLEGAEFAERLRENGGRRSVA